MIYRAHKTSRSVITREWIFSAVRGVSKSIVETAFAHALANPFTLRRQAGRVLVLAYHNVTPPGLEPAGDHAMQVPFEQFCKQLDLLEELCIVTALEDLAEGREQDEKKPTVVLTFDDAYSGAVRYALPEISRRGLSATVFVAPMFLDGGQFWWDALSSPELGPLDEESRYHCLTHLKGRTKESLDWAASRGLRIAPLPAFARGANLTELEMAASLRGIRFGAHSWSHPNLATLSDEELKFELTEPYNWLKDRFAKATIPAVAYPYGLFSSQTERMARQLGYTWTLRINGGWCPRGFLLTDPLPRVNVPSGLSLQGLRLRIAGYV